MFGGHKFELKTPRLGGVEGEVSYYVTGWIKKYHSIFEEPKSLPPIRRIYDHKISLEHETNLVSVHPL